MLRVFAGRSQASGEWSASARQRDLWPCGLRRLGTARAEGEPMESWRVAEIVLLSVLGGALLPVLFQLRSTLRAAEQFIESAGPRLDRSLAEVTAAADRI